jgi:D-aminoacyl-tRNA deacylase
LTGVFAENGMIGLVQRVSDARLVINGAVIAAIGRGLVVLVGVERGDDENTADRLLDRLLGYRVFPDDAGRMNLSLRDIRADLMLVPQVTLAANTGRGARPSFSSAASPEAGVKLYEYFVARACSLYPHVGSGRFGADMKVTLTNDGPVTFWLRVPPQTRSGH